LSFHAAPAGDFFTQLNSGQGEVSSPVYRGWGQIKPLFPRPKAGQFQLMFDFAIYQTLLQEGHFIVNIDNLKMQYYIFSGGFMGVYAQTEVYKQSTVYVCEIFTSLQYSPFTDWVLNEYNCVPKYVEEENEL
jgi:hypothetical protein